MVAESDETRNANAPAVTVVGAGLAGCEAAWQLARLGCGVRLFEMRPAVRTGAHRTAGPAELVCSNSFKGRDISGSHGALKAEGRLLGSLLLRLAEECAVPAGGALAVDRERFSRAVERTLADEPLIELVRAEVTTFPTAPAVLAAGPLPSPALADELRSELGSRRLFFHDATAPVVTRESLDESRLFAAGRHGRDGDYLNVGLSREDYAAFIEGLSNAPRAPVAGVDEELVDGDYAVFEGCLPLEVLAGRSPEAPRFGPLRPVGLRNPATGESYHAVLQLRAEDAAGERWGLVGCQTRLTPPAQRDLFRRLPGLERAEFVRYGRMHRNGHLDGPRLLRPTLELRGRPGVFVAGQLSGAEGYSEAVLTGLLAGVNLARQLTGLSPLTPPRECLLGALTRTLAGEGLASGTAAGPVNANFGLTPPLAVKVRGRRDRRRARALRGLAACRAFNHRLRSTPLPHPGVSP